MKYIIGAYSQLPPGSSAEEYEALLAGQLKPLLTTVYRNSDCMLLFRLGISAFEYFEQNHPEINMLINDLCRKGQMEILTSSYYDAVLSLIPTHERPSQIEKTTTFIRKNFSRRPRGLWLYNQVFNPSFVPLVSLSGLDYLVISTYNQTGYTVEQTRPFYTAEMGRESLVFPVDDRFSSLVHDLYHGGLSNEKFISEMTKRCRESSGALTTIMLNLDQMMGTPGSADVFGALYGIAGKNCTLPGIYLQENEITKTQYLSNGIYGRDFNIGKASSINQLIYDSPMLSRNYALVNMLKEVEKDNKKNLDDRKNIENLLMKASSSSLYFPDECRIPSVMRYSNRYACEVETILAKMPNCILPEERDLDFDRCEEFIVPGRSSISHLSRKGAVLSSFTVMSSFFDTAFHSGEGLFADSFTDDRTSRVTRLSAKTYEVTPLDRRRSDFFAKAPEILLGKKPVGLTKRYKFRQSTVVVEIEIENLSDETISGFTYTSTVNLAFPVRCTAVCPEGEIPDGKSILTQSIGVSDRNCPFSISLVFGCECFVQKEDFTRNTHTWLGDKSYYEYTQFKIQKKLTLDPGATDRLTIGFRTEKRKGETQ